MRSQVFFVRNKSSIKTRKHFVRELLFNENLSCHYNIVAVVLIFTLLISEKLQHAISTSQFGVFAHCWCSHSKQLTRDVFTLSSALRFYVLTPVFLWLFSTTIIILKTFWAFCFLQSVNTGHVFVFLWAIFGFCFELQ